ncbi:Signal transduction histidine kinase [Verrucomicrobium sp. GAS474]|uniref:ATP-binding response regulator n=1 Tax=Verrucomicrobium sp. GAS474 TaxID=1882831 RepID=UPI00087C7E19|nr:HAMP domain-containing sensor histidine kinase [Verrucomicrobium sp. GAS474]SDT95539.1 Signal transduction histidine kinase [Verrucomicrobium sp. GAS474]
MNDLSTPSHGPRTTPPAIAREIRKLAAQILLVENEPDLARAFSEMLRKVGYRVVVAEDGVNAVDFLKEATPDLILSDIEMGGLDGWNLLRYVRSTPKLAATPVIFLTGLSGEEKVREAMALGADDFLKKPIDRKTLLDAIASRLGRAQNYREACQGRLRRQKDFVSLIAHDLGGPLTTFRLGLDMLALDPEKKTHDALPIDALQGAVESMTRMVERLVLMARDPGDDIPLQLRRTNVADLCRRALRHALGVDGVGRGALCNIEADPTDHAWIDPTLVEQVICNLLSNAFKYSPEGNPVTLTAEFGSGHLRFEVADTGSGIPADEIERLYQPFFRSTRHRHIAGNGVGLFGVKLLVERHGGRIECQSLSGVGSRFVVLLPLGGPRACEGGLPGSN